VALEKGESEAASLREELRQAVTLLRDHADLMAVLTHPAVSLEQKKKIAEAVGQEQKLSDLSRRLLVLLVARERLGLLADIERIYGEIWNAHRGVITAEAVTAAPLDGAQSRALSEALQHATGHQVELQATLDPAVLGGVLINMEGRVYDGTVRGRLRALRAHLTGTGLG